MVRLVLVIAVLATGVVVMKQRSDAVGVSSPAAPQVNSSKVPEEFRAILADAPDPAQILRSKGALPGLGAISRLTGGDSGADEQPGPRPFADVGSRRELRKVRGDIRRDLAALNRLTHEGGGSLAAAERTLDQVYSAPVLERLGTDGRRAFASQLLGRTRVAQRVKVVDFEGVFVSGSRALAQVVYRLSTRSPSGRFVAGAPATWTVRLAHEGGRWRFVQGFETGD
jgi:hypothetical protein